MLTTTPSSPLIEVTTLPQLSPVGAWQVELSHDRAQDLVVWITRGQGRLMLDGKRRGFGAHNVFFVPAGTLWSIELGRQSLGSCLFLPRNTKPAESTHPMFLRVQDSQDQAYLTFILERLQREQRQQRLGWQASMHSLSELLLIELRRAAAGQAAGRRDSASQKLCRAYCHRVAQGFDQGATMSDHAEALDVTPTHLTRVCKAETGKTAATLLTERQLYSARTQLTYSDVPIQDIAAKLGFGSAAYFTRFITQHTGLTPSRLRKSTRASAATTSPAPAVS